MRKAAAVLAGLTLALGPWGGVAVADGPPVSHELVPGAHTHHVHTGNGGCVDIDSVYFLPLDHGLHQGANSSTSARGPWHGPCHQ